MTDPAPAYPQKLSPAVRWRDRVITTAVLVTVWMLLWGVFSWANLISGLAVSALVVALFPLPPVTFAGRLHPRPLLHLIRRFITDLVSASVQLAALAFRPGRPPSSAIIRVPLRALVPGSLIVDTDQASTTLYIHVIGVPDREAVERFRREVYETEARIVRAICSRDEIAMLDRAVAQRKDKSA